MAVANSNANFYSNECFHPVGYIPFMHFCYFKEVNSPLGLTVLIRSFSCQIFNFWNTERFKPKHHKIFCCDYFSCTCLQQKSVLIMDNLFDDLITVGLHCIINFESFSYHTKHVVDPVSPDLRLKQLLECWLTAESNSIDLINISLLF